MPRSQIAVEDVRHSTSPSTNVHSSIVIARHLGPDGFGWVGCNGRAVALSISLGRELAKATQGTAIETLGLPLSEPKAQPFRDVARKLAPFALPLYRRLDAQEI